MFSALLGSMAVFRLLLALPLVIMLSNAVLRDGSMGILLREAGEWAARFLILTLAVTPVRLLLRQLGAGPRWPMWLLKRRRDLGVATFIYAAVHLAVYLIRQPSLNAVLFDLPYTAYLFGWAAFFGLLLLVLFSNDTAVHRLGRWWKPIQRLVYLAAVAAFLHWIWIKRDDTAAIVHFAPLLLLECYRLWYNFTRPSGVRHHE